MSHYSNAETRLIAEYLHDDETLRNKFLQSARETLRKAGVIPEAYLAGSIQFELESVASVSMVDRPKWVQILFRSSLEQVRLMEVAESFLEIARNESFQSIEKQPVRNQSGTPGIDAVFMIGILLASAGCLASIVNLVVG